MFVDQDQPIKFVKSLPSKATYRGDNRGPRMGRRKLFVAALKQNPKRWAHYPTNESASAGSITTTAVMLRKTFPGVEACVRQGKVYARWIGGAR